MGHRLRGRMLVEQGGLAYPLRVAGARKGNPSVSSNGRFPKTTLRAEGHILLRPLPLYLPELDDTWLRFVDGRPVSSITRRGSFCGVARGSKRLARECSASHLG
jgi:hypothetical protein